MDAHNCLSCGCCLGCKPLLGLLNDRQLNTLTLGKSYPWLGALANGVHIAQSSGKFVSGGILNVDCLKASLMLLSVLNHSNTPSVPSTSNHDHIPDIELDKVGDFVALQIKLNGVVGLDERVRVTDGSPIIGVQIRDTLLAKLHRADFAQLKLQQNSQTIRGQLSIHIGVLTYPYISHVY